MKLKTLKDIKSNILGELKDKPNSDETFAVNMGIKLAEDTLKHYIREEAKNWLKHTETMPPISKDVLSKFIKHFFNISEEDLK